MMGGICLAAGLLLGRCDGDITLRWTHSIEKVVWEEDYRREGDALRLVEARVRGTGAGMEPPAGAILRDGAWHYRPQLPPLPEVQLRHSPYVPPYMICCDGRCQPLPAWLPGLPADSVVTLAPCPNEPRRPFTSTAANRAGRYPCGLGSNFPCFSRSLMILCGTE